MCYYVMYQFTDLLVVAIKGHGLGSLDAVALQDLERGICVAGERRRKWGEVYGVLTARLKHNKWNLSHTEGFATDT